MYIGEVFEPEKVIQIGDVVPNACFPRQFTAPIPPSGKGRRVDVVVTKSH
jgi:hypothetical protein